MHKRIFFKIYVIENNSRGLDGDPQSCSGCQGWMPLISEGASWGEVHPDPKHAVEIGRDSSAATQLAQPKWLAGKSSLSKIHPSHAPNIFPLSPGLLN